MAHRNRRARSTRTALPMNMKKTFLFIMPSLATSTNFSTSDLARWTRQLSWSTANTGLFTFPNRLEFRNELHALGVFQSESKFFTTHLSECIEGVCPIDRAVFEQNQDQRPQFTDVPLDSVNLDKLGDVFKAVEAISNDPQLKTLLEIIAIVNLARLFNFDVYMEHFEGFTREEMSDHLCIDEVTAK